MAGKKKKKSGGKSCTRQTISFKTKRGKKVTFTGRPGGKERNDGVCTSGPKPKTGHLKHWKDAFRKAAKSCKGSPSKRRACISKALRAA